MRVALAALCLALLTAGCDPIGEVRFVIVNTGGAPVAAASVVMTCPGNAVPEEHAQSGPDGTVTYQSIPDIAPTCTFTIEKPGFVTKSLSRADVGYHKGIHAEATPVKIVLDPAPATGAATQAPTEAPAPR
jgi:hypothetical protein